MDWIHPWIGLDWIGSEAQKIIFEQLNCFIVLLSRSRLELLLTSQSERDFSSVGRTVTDARSQLSASKVEAVEMLRWGLKAGLM